MQLSSLQLTKIQQLKLIALLAAHQTTRAVNPRPCKRAEEKTDTLELGTMTTTSDMFIKPDELDRSETRLMTPIQTTSAKRGARATVIGTARRQVNSEATLTHPLNSRAISNMRRQVGDRINQSSMTNCATCTTSDKMCNSSPRQAHSGRRSARPALSLRRPPHSPPVRSLTKCMCLALALSLCLLVASTGASDGPSSEGTAATAPKPAQETHKAPLERSDPAASASDSTNSGAASSSSSSSSPASSQRSIVASLSSAVATAAAAAAVAAAQNGLSTSDARSLSSSPAHTRPVSRSPGLNLAIKLVDTIPEVPYSILHNMKKVDHAAPFYNAPNKHSGGIAKESSQNFISNALAASGAGEQLGSFFKSPLWKRIADGYGDFASEFRTMFRAPGAAPMKGPASSTSKILRDISVPALLMLLASSIKSEWRPVRTRRKSFRPLDIPASGVAQLRAPSALETSGIDPLLGESSMSQASSLPAGDMSSAQQQAGGETQYFQRYEHHNQPQQRPQSQEAYQSAQNPTGYPPTTLNNEWPPMHQQQVINAGGFNFGQQTTPQVGQLTPRVKDDVNLQAMGSHQRANWLASEQAVSLAALGGNPGEQQPALDLQAATFGQQLARRSAEIQREPAYGNEMQFDLTGQESSPIGATIGDGYSRRLMSLIADNNGAMTSIKRSDHLGDQLRYSLVGSDEISAGADSPAASDKHILSAMAHAVGSVLRPSANGVSAGGKSGSLSSWSSSDRPNFLIRSSNLMQNLMAGGVRAINEPNANQVIMRRQQQQSPAEQRDLTKLLPESWREVVKRTMTTVQQQANTQWKSIEGQLANWVQDKLKAVAASAPAGASQVTASASGSSSPASNGAISPPSITSALPAPIGNMLASASSTALNILGLNKNNSSGSSAQATVAAAASSQAKSQSKGDEQSAATPVNDRGKLEPTKPAAKPGQHQPTSAKGALAGVANLIASSISLKNSPSSHKQTPSHNTNPANEPPKSPALGETASSKATGANSSIASSYPTLSGPDASSLASVPTRQPSASSSPAAITASGAQVSPSSLGPS